MTDWLMPLAGAVVLAVLAVDVFQTVFNARGRGGPINRRQNRLVWRVVRWLGTAGRERPGLMALAGPLMAVITVVVWTLLLIGGFALIYGPYVLDFHYSTGDPGSVLLEAFYYSGIVAATLGHGDVVAPGGVFRVLTVIQALAGFAAVSVGITYILSIYRQLIQAQSLASTIHSLLSVRSGGGDRGRMERDGRQEGGADPPDRDAWDRSLALALTQAIEAHHSYPILHYFRPSRRERALTYQVARLLAVEGGGDPAHEGAASLSAGILAVVVRRYIGEVHELFVASGAGSEEEVGPADRMTEILAMLAYDPPREG